MRFVAAAAILLGWWAQVTLGRAQETTVQSFDGAAPTMTASFTVSDKWEARWMSPDAIGMTILSPNGAVVAKISGSGQGSIYLPKGGTFTLQIERPGVTGSSLPWHISVVEDGAAGVGTNVVMTPALAPSPTTNLVAPPAPAAPAANEDLAVVLIKGDLGEGTGFLTRTADGPVVITNIHVISANPNIHIQTTTGEEIKTLGLKGAADRDLAMFSIQDNHYNYLDLATDIKDTVEEGDAALIPGNSEGGEVMLNTKGDILGIGPEKIEFSNPIYHGNSGGPVLHVKSGKVVAVVEGAYKVAPSDELDKASLASANSAITGSMRYFGLRLDTVPQWDVYDPERFLSETLFSSRFTRRAARSIR
jgi:hypothetical protein